MRAASFTRFGPAVEVLEVGDLPRPDPAAGDVLVRLARSGVNPSDVKQRAGGRPGVTGPPFARIIPHSDGAGVIEAVGQGVDPARIGQRVWIWNGQWRRAFGTAAQYIALPEAQAVPLPDAVSLDTGATLGIPGLTATHCVLGGGPVRGKRVLVSGGSGMVGHLAVQIAAASGAAQVIATASPARAHIAQESGAAAVIDHAAPDLAQRITDAAGGPIDLAVEVEFGENAQMLAEVMAETGRIAAYGSARAMTPVLPFYPMMFKALTLEMVLIYLLPPAERAAALSAMMALASGGALRPRIAEVLPLADVARAHDMVAAGNRDGAVLLDCS